VQKSEYDWVVNASLRFTTIIEENAKPPASILTAIQIKKTYAVVDEPPYIGLQMNTPSQTQMQQYSEILAILAPFDGDEPLHHVLATNQAVLLAVFKAPGYSKELFKNATISEARNIYVQLQDKSALDLATILKDWYDLSRTPLIEPERKCIATDFLDYPAGTHVESIVDALNKEHPDLRAAEMEARFVNVHIDIRVPRWGKLKTDYRKNGSEAVSGVKGLLWKKLKIEFYFDPVTGLAMFPHSSPVELDEHWKQALRNTHFNVGVDEFVLNGEWNGWFAIPVDLYNAQRMDYPMHASVDRDPVTKLFIWKTPAGMASDDFFASESEAYLDFYYLSRNSAVEAS
jgi:hypothetical protein